MSTVHEAAHRFDDSEAYERFMGAWSRAAMPLFLRWLSAPRDADWLDVGCGTGILAQSARELGFARRVDGVDPAQAQVRYAARTLAGPHVRFHVAQAEALPFADGRFDVVASALAINFMADRRKALAEMRRVVRAGGIVAGFVWDFARERSPSGPMRKALRAVGSPAPEVPGTRDSTIDALRRSFSNAGLVDISTCAFEVAASFASFEDFWLAQLPAYSPTTKLVLDMSEPSRMRLKTMLRSCVPVGSDGSISYSAGVHAVRGFAG